MTTDTLPHNQDAERTIIAKLLLDPNQIALVGGKLRPDDFYVSDYRDAFRAMLALSEAQLPVHVISVIEKAGRDLDLSLTFLTEAHGGSVEDYISTVKDNAERRRTISTADRIKAIALRHGSNVLAEVQDEIGGLVKGTTSGNLLDPAAMVDLYLTALKRRVSGEVGQLKYQIGRLDNTLQPAAAGDMVIVAARPSVGKTAMAEVIADSWAAQSQYPVLFVSLEMSINQLLDRSISRYSDIAASRIIRGTLTDEEYALAKETVERRRSVGIWYLDDGFATTASVRAAAARVKLMAGGITGIVVDYLQLLNDSGDFEVQRVTKISRTLKAIAREFGCPVLVLSQLNRAVEMRSDKHPRLYDLRESGSLEQDADVVLALTRELGESVMDVDILKNRNGPSTRIQVQFDTSRVSFSEMGIDMTGQPTDWASMVGAEEDSAEIVTPLAF